MAEFIDVKFRSEALRATLKGIPPALAKGYAAAAQRAGERFLRYHRKQRLSAQRVEPSGPLFAKGTQRKLGQPSGPGFIGRRTIAIVGTSLDNLRLELRMPGAVARTHEEGRTVESKGYLPVPMPAAKDSKGRVAAWAKKLLKQERNILQAREEGFNIFKGKRRLRGLVRITAKSGKKYIARINPGKKGQDRLTLLFHLERRVRNKPRLGFIQSWREFRGQAIRIFRQTLPFAIAAAQRKAAFQPQGAASGD